MRFLFIATMTSSRWGGSEELWSQAAVRLAAQGFPVAASVHGHEPLHARLLEMRQLGIEVRGRQNSFPVHQRLLHRISRARRSLHEMDLLRFIRSQKPDLIIISAGGARPPIDVLEICAEADFPFVVISQANNDSEWPDDDLASRYRATLSVARRYYFVSDANKRLAEKQVGCPLHNAEVVRNPFNVPYDARPPWPAINANDELHMACVARLHPPSKGQDMLFEVLAEPQWVDRKWVLSLYGDGPSKNALGRLVKELGLSGRVLFKGHISDVAEIWTQNHVLVLPSRYEGLPLAMVEAMLCGRAAVATDVAGNAEILVAGHTGFLAQAPTVDSIRKALEQMWGARGKLKTMGQNAAASVRTKIPRDPVGEVVDKLKSLA